MIYCLKAQQKLKIILKKVDGGSGCARRSKAEGMQADKMRVNF